MAIQGSYKDDIIRIELRSGEKPYTSECKKCKEVYSANEGVKVAYFMPIHTMKFSEILTETVAIMKLIFRGYFRKKYKSYKQYQFGVKHNKHTNKINTHHGNKGL